MPLPNETQLEVHNASTAAMSVSLHESRARFLNNKLLAREQVCLALSGGMDVKELVSDYLFTYCNSETRLEEMLTLVSHLEPKIFWLVFLNVWDCCDNTWFTQLELSYILREMSWQASYLDYADNDTKMFHRRLPRKFQVHRGCSLHRKQGISWTTDLKIAESFAHGHRNISVPDGGVLSITIKRKDVLASFVGRNESEVLIDFERYEDAIESAVHVPVGMTQA